MRLDDPGDVVADLFQLAMRQLLRSVWRLELGQHAALGVDERQRPAPGLELWQQGRGDGRDLGEGAGLGLRTASEMSGCLRRMDRGWPRTHSSAAAAGAPSRLVRQGALEWIAAEPRFDERTRRLIERPPWCPERGVDARRSLAKPRHGWVDDNPCDMRGAAGGAFVVRSRCSAWRAACSERARSRRSYDLLRDAVGLALERIVDCADLEFRLQRQPSSGGILDRGPAGK
jgi:hypothetical protein